MCLGIWVESSFFGHFCCLHIRIEIQIEIRLQLDNWFSLTRSLFSLSLRPLATAKNNLLQFSICRQSAIYRFNVTHTKQFWPKTVGQKRQTQQTTDTRNAIKTQLVKWQSQSFDYKSTTKSKSKFKWNAQKNN